MERAIKAVESLHFEITPIPPTVIQERPRGLARVLLGHQDLEQGAFTEPQTVPMNIGFITNLKDPQP